MMIGRREFLRGAGASIALPLLPSLAWGRGTPEAPPVRAVWLYFPTGVAEGSWHPRRVARDGTPWVPTKIQLAVRQYLWWLRRSNMPPVSTTSTNFAFDSKVRCSTDRGIWYALEPLSLIHI